MPKSILIADPAATRLEAEPVSRDWILSGAPEGASKVLARSSDWMLTLVVWECTAGRFEWHYKKDEILFVVSGEAIITTAQAKEFRMGPGDVVFFPAGTSCTWLIKDRIRKVAVLRETLWKPVGICITLASRLARMVGWGIVKLRSKPRGPVKA
jgi:uncharacterized protein